MLATRPHPADPEAPVFSLLRRRDEELALAGYVVAELDRDRALMDVLEDPSVQATLDGREHLLADLAGNMLVCEAVERRRVRVTAESASAFGSLPVAEWVAR